MKLEEIWNALELNIDDIDSGDLVVHTPVDGTELGCIRTDNTESVSSKVAYAREAYLQWRTVPAPRRGELVRLFGEELRRNKDHLGALVTLECGKIIQEGKGEVQEMIDICDFAVGLSRQLYGLTMPSERPGHRMSEYWHPAGVVGVISAFNFPVAVWAWNAVLAIVCGDSVVWKPSEKTPLTALACVHLFNRAARDVSEAPDHLVELLIGGKDTGEALVNDDRVPVISATGSTAMGKRVAPDIAARLGRSILELGGNNAMIITPSANLDLAERAILFSAVGTAGQRCTTLRRLIAHKDVYERLVDRLSSAYQQINVGNPFHDTSLVGPLIDEHAYQNMQETLEQLRESGSKVTGGERITIKGCDAGYYVQPAFVEVKPDNVFTRTETFAPILYIMSYENFEDAIAIHNDVPQGLSSCIFTQDIDEAERFISATGSDCGIANVNIGPSGAEIGGAFGGEKETGGGRESGSDAWKAYMRRSTVTVNYSGELPLAQGIRFGTGS